jgi:N-acetylmuramoyl-L-alanine amidase
MKLIRIGDRSQEAADVQARLRELGFEIDDEPSHFGEATRRSVMDFQQRRGILIDGIVGPNTWSELVEAGWRIGDRALYLARPLMRGDDVLALQARLNALGFDAGREDGIFGRDTDAAVRAFQHEYAIEEDGIFGLRSHSALQGLRVDRPMTASGLREELARSQRVRGIQSVTVMIDPGHGGQDLGDRSPQGSFEADLCWDICMHLAAMLGQGGARVRLSRMEAEGPDATERAVRANSSEAEVFLSIHLNSHSEPNAEGASTYYFPRSKSGEMIAEAIRDDLVELGLPDCRSHARSYSILKETRMPAVLIEPAFITNPDEAKMLEDADFRRTLAQAISSGVRRYFDQEG